MKSKKLLFTVGLLFSQSVFSQTKSGSETFQVVHEVACEVDLQKKQDLELRLNALNTDIHTLEGMLTRQKDSLLKNGTKNTYNRMYKKIRKNMIAILDLAGRENIKDQFENNPSIKRKIEFGKSWRQSTMETFGADDPVFLSVLSVGLYPLFLGVSTGLATLSHGCAIAVTCGQDCDFTGVKHNYYIDKEDWASSIRFIKLTIQQVADLNRITLHQ